MTAALRKVEDTQVWSEVLPRGWHSASLPISDVPCAKPGLGVEGAADLLPFSQSLDSGQPLFPALPGPTQSGLGTHVL
jgi:hypothetical protein